MTNMAQFPVLNLTRRDRIANPGRLMTVHAVRAVQPRCKCGLLLNLVTGQCAMGGKHS